MFFIIMTSIGAGIIGMAFKMDGLSSRRTGRIFKYGLSIVSMAVVIKLITLVIT